MIYLDYNATTPLRACALEAITAVFQHTGNPASVHTFGRRVRQVVDEGRAQIAGALHATPQQVIFTSGGTEANNLALRGLQSNISQIFIGATEHDSVYAILENVEIIPVNTQGLIDIGALEELLKKVTPPFLVSVMLANNETGVIQDVQAIAESVHKFGGFLHTDAAQALGKISVDFKALGIDLMTLSAHKVGGPAGVGALVVKESVPLKALLKGGGQERGMRSGTLCAALITGFAVALLEAEKQRFEGRWHQNQRWHLWMEQNLKESCPEAIIFGEKAPRLPNTTCLTMPHISHETQVMAFDLEGIAVSAGSACSSGKIKASHVLTHMGFPLQTAQTAIRISSGWNTVESDMIRFVDMWEKISSTLIQKRAS